MPNTNITIRVDANGNVTVDPTQAKVYWDDGADLHWELVNGSKLSLGRPNHPWGRPLFNRPVGGHGASFDLRIPPRDPNWPRDSYHYSVSGTSNNGPFDISSCPEIIIQ